MARHPLQASRDGQQFLHLRIVLLELLQRLALLERFVERHVEGWRNLLGHSVHVGERHLEHAADVAHHCLRLHRPEGDDLSDVLPPVLPGDVLDDLAAPPLAEVDVDVGHRDALGVEEPLEDQIEAKRIDVRDPHAVRHEAAGRRPAAGPDWNALLAGVADEVPDDEEVPGVLHLFDHVDFVRESPFVLVNRVAQRPRGSELPQPRQPFGEALTRHVFEVLVEREGRGHVEIWQVILTLGKDDVAALGDSDRVPERLRPVLEDLRHLFRRLQEKLFRLVPKPLADR